ncbi:MAG TPA: hypothetical protein VLK56_11100 [Solirubrobacterales bacterium]|nr:hypothetical protein [Solirubrobacterales bacterium]
MPGKLGTFLLIAATALSTGLSAAAAQAEVTFTVPKLGGSIEGQRTGSDRFLSDGIEVGCGGVSYRAAPEGNSRTIEIEPEFYECAAKGLSGLPADFFQEDCAFLLHDVKHVPGVERWKAGGVGIRCHGGYTAIGWTIFETEKKYEEVRQLCSTRIPQQIDGGTAELSNLAGPRGGIEVHWDLDKLEYRVVYGSSIFCGPMLGLRRGTSYKGSARVFGKDFAGHPAKFEMSG